MYYAGSHLGSIIDNGISLRNKYNVIQWIVSLMLLISKHFHTSLNFNLRQFTSKFRHQAVNIYSHKYLINNTTYNIEI